MTVGRMTALSKESGRDVFGGNTCPRFTSAPWPFSQAPPRHPVLTVQPGPSPPWASASPSALIRCPSSKSLWVQEGSRPKAGPCLPACPPQPRLQEARLPPRGHPALGRREMEPQGPRRVGALGGQRAGSSANHGLI